MRIMKTRILRKIKARYKYTQKQHPIMPVIQYDVFDKKTKKHESYWGFASFVFSALVDMYGLDMAFRYKDRNYPESHRMQVRKPI